ncbi:MAG TPA: HAD-IIA family hydrolase [Acidimicrobiales bacterium]|nr:HAD-IIA family hydrolase [Acidimicrobiales bacterium]
MTGTGQATWILDCDGVIWLADEPIPGAAEAVEHLRAAGTRVVFITNNSYPTRAEHLAKLDHMGMSSDPSDLISSSMAAAALLESGDRVLMLGGPGIREALEARGVEAFEPGEVRGEGALDAVVVGFDLQFDFSRLAAAAAALRAGARLIATNDDATFPTSSGLLPGAGSFVAAVATAGGVVPEVAGKPFAPVVDLVKQTLGPVAVVVGDRPSTDGRLAERLGAKFALVLTGVTAPGHGPVDPEPALEADDLPTVVKQLTGAR